jgi:hypothetical protein
MTSIANASEPVRASLLINGIPITAGIDVTLEGRSATIDLEDLAAALSLPAPRGGSMSVREAAEVLGRLGGWDPHQKIVFIVPHEIPDFSRAGDPIPIPGKSYGPFDVSGIPTKDYGGKVGIQYNAVVVQEFAQLYFHHYVTTGDEHYRAKFLQMVDWLVTHLKPLPGDAEASVWVYTFDWFPYNLAPWISAFTQASGIDCFVSAYMMTGDRAYLQNAERAMRVLDIPVDRGGVQTRDAAGRPWLEEYPGAPPSRVLPGFGSTLLSLDRFATVTVNRRARQLFQAGVETLAAMIQFFDDPGDLVSRYDLFEQFMFRFATRQASIPADRHPIASITVFPPTDQPFRIDLGSASAATGASNRIVAAPSTYWTDVYEEDGRAVRAFANVNARYTHAALTLSLSGNLSAGREHRIEVAYRDVSKEPVLFQVYSDRQSRYVPLGELAHEADGHWKVLTAAVPPEMLARRGFGHSADRSYHQMNVGLMRLLGEITGQRVLTSYALKWAGYQVQREELAHQLRQATAIAKLRPAAAQTAAMQVLAAWPDNADARKFMTDLAFPHNWATTATVAAQTHFFPEPNGVEAALDGDHQTYAAGQPMSNPQSFELDLGAARTIARVGIHWYSRADYGEDFSIDAFHDGQWVPLVTERRAQPPDGRHIYPLAVPVVAQRVRVVVTKFHGQNRMLMRDLFLEGE